MFIKFFSSTQKGIQPSHEDFFTTYRSFASLAAKKNGEVSSALVEQQT